MTRAEEILRFWFADSLRNDADLSPYVARWFGSDANFDRSIAERFGADTQQAADGAFDGWKESPRGRLALIILLDQFTRNVFRGMAKAYACDAQAAQICLEGLAAGADRSLAPVERLFFYLPLLHSERLADQDRSVECFRRLAAECDGAQSREFEQWLRLARRHRRIVAWFGRFPHRNVILGRTSTAAERIFLIQGRVRERAARNLRGFFGRRHQTA